ncbi:MAG: BatD family protein [bacterium]|nr:BatD family protein [bacterium]
MGHRVFFLLLATLFWAQPLWAQVRVQADLPADKLVVGDEMMISLRVENADNSARLELPQVKGLTLRQMGPPSTSSQTTVINGQMTRYTGLTFAVGLSADQPGQYRIPPIMVVYQGQSYPSQAVVIEAVQGRDLGAISLKMEVDHQRIYLGQPLVVSLTWDVLESLEDYAFRVPLLYDKDQLNLRLAPLDPSAKTEELRLEKFKVAFESTDLGPTGTRYRTGFRLFPQKTGTFLIPAVHVKALVPRGQTFTRDFFGRLQRRPQTQPAYASAGPIRVEVLPLPQAGRPADFKGAVGEFKIEADAAHRSYQVGEPIELKLRIWGDGDLTKIERPQLKGFRPAFDFRENLAPGDLADDSLIFTQQLSAQEPGEKTLPAVELPFFNPQTGRYEVARSEPIHLKISAAEELKAQDIFGPGLARTSKQPSAPPGFLSQQAPQTQPWWIWLGPLPILAWVLWSLQRRGSKAPEQAAARPWTAEALKPLGDLPGDALNRAAQEHLEAWLVWQLGPRRRWGEEEFAALEAQCGPATASAARQLDRALEAAQYGGGSALAGEQVLSWLAVLAQAEPPTSSSSQAA